MLLRPLLSPLTAHAQLAASPSHSHSESLTRTLRGKRRTGKLIFRLMFPYPPELCRSKHVSGERSAIVAACADQLSEEAATCLSLGQADVTQSISGLKIRCGWAGGSGALGNGQTLGDGEITTNGPVCTAWHSVDRDVFGTPVPSTVRVAAPRRVSDNLQACRNASPGAL